MRLEKREFKGITNVLLVSESEEESLILDLLSSADGKTKVVGDVIQKGTYEVRLEDGYGEHYVMLKGNSPFLYPEIDTVTKDYFYMCACGREVSRVRECETHECPSMAKRYGGEYMVRRKPV